MAIALRILPGDRTPEVVSGTTILKAAHAAGVDITATCGGRGRCTSCRVKFIEGAVPPPTIMDELQLGDDLVRDGYRLSCQCGVTEPITDRKSTRLNSSHTVISYAVFCLKKKKKKHHSKSARKSE